MTFEQIIEEFILPLFPGTIIEPEKVQRKPTSYQLAINIQPTKIGLMLSRNWTERLVIQRSQIFTKGEKEIINLFLQGISQLEGINLDEKLKTTLYPTIFKQTIAKSISNEGNETITKIIDIFESLSGRTYEGNNLSLAIGIGTSENSQSISFSELLNNDFGLVLSNGVHTLIEVSNTGKIISHNPLEDYTPNKFSPVSYITVANWSKENKTAIVLNRNAEILIFHNGKLLFSKRRQKWQYYSHETIIKLISGKTRKSWSPKLREAIYESLLDVSFARSGGLIGLLARREDQAALNKLISDDVPSLGNSTPKSKYFSNIRYLPFDKLPRRIRQEILAIDGSVIINYKGQILNIGSIVTEIKPTAEGGARTAAAIALSEHGVAIKISMDGMIKGFKNNNSILKFG